MAAGGDRESDASRAKAEGAFRTIGEVSAELGVSQHVLRYWETRFPQLRPVTRAGNRRYYRPADVQLARRIRQLLGEQGYTVKGVQKLLEGTAAAPSSTPATAGPPVPPAAVEDEPSEGARAMLAELIAIRDQLAAALEDDAALA